jgi:hypothetical protein
MLVRCGTPDCDWGLGLANTDSSEMERCRREFRKQCVESHNLDSEDTERNVWLDMAAWTMTLLV